MTHPYLEDFLRQCKTDRELQDAIRDLRKALEGRKARRLYNRILNVIAPLGAPERAILLAVYHDHNTSIEDTEAFQKLRDAKLAVPRGWPPDGCAVLTTLGMRAAVVLKQRQVEVTIIP